MPDLKKVIGELEYCRDNQKCNACEKCQRGGRGVMTCESLVDDALAILKEQEESIPISWLKEKLEGHPELSYAVTDGIINVLDLWKGR